MKDVSDKIEDFGDRYGYFVGDLLKYAEKKHGVEVRIVRKPEQSGKSIEAAVVETLDDEEVEFNIHINYFGIISGYIY